MRTKTATSLALLFLFSLGFALSVYSQERSQPRSQSTDKTRKLRESFTSDRTRVKEARKEKYESESAPDGAEWFKRGYELHNADRYQEAAEAFMCAVALEYRPATAMYNIACDYALLNDKENAFVWLQRSLESGFDRSELVASDSDLDPLRTDPRFQKLLAAIPNVKESTRSRNEKTDSRPADSRPADLRPDRLAETNLTFTRLERETSPDGEEWANVGVNLLRLRELDRAVVALNHAVTFLGSRGSSAMYNLACAYALRRDRDAGIQWLEKSVNAGFDDPEKLRNDPDLNNLRADDRFSRIENLSKTLSLSQFNDKRSADSDSSNYSKERWAPAIALYQGFLKTEPNSGRGWFNLGFALHYSREHTRAVEAFQRALALGFREPESNYNVACAYAMLNQRDLAFAWLDRAVKAGLDASGQIIWDHDLDNLRSDPRFKRLSEGANYNVKVRTKK